MVKRIKQEDMAGALELQGISKDDLQLQQWLEEHRGRNGGKLRVGPISAGAVPRLDSLDPRSISSIATASSPNASTGSSRASAIWTAI